MEKLNCLSYEVIGLAIDVHKQLGPGLLESAYLECLYFELIDNGFRVEKEKALPLIYREVHIDYGYRIDLLVEDQLVIELKSVEALNEVHFAQVLTYLRLGNYRLGLLINYNVNSLKTGIRRIVY